jgi:hypothetical protein
MLASQVARLPAFAFFAAFSQRSLRLTAVILAARKKDLNHEVRQENAAENAGTLTSEATSQISG